MKNIIFVFRTTALFSYSSSIINEINKKENKVTLVFIRESSSGSTLYRIKTNKDTGLKELVSENPILNRSEVLVSESEKISIAKGKERSDRWTYPLRIIRETVSLLSYIKRENQSTYYHRQKRRVPKIIANWITSKIFGKYLSPLGIINRVLKLINDIIPVSNEIKTFLDSLKGNCVVVVGANYATDPTYFSSGIDYIKACSALKIPSVIQIVSWDNLTTKGLYHYKPTLMLAWNKAHEEEAINIHNIPKERIAITGSPFMDKWFNHKFKIRTKKEFFSALSLNPNVPLVTYLGSSINIVGEEEAGIAEKLFQNLRRKGIQMIIRPHGANSAQFKSLASKIPVIPQEGDLPDTSDTKRLMVETMSYSSATVGINTTAMIDSIILGTPSVTLLKKEFDYYRKSQKPHPMMLKNKLNFVPFKHQDIDHWRNARTGGISYLDEKTNLIIHGGVDDVWFDRDQKKLVVVDYKAQSSIGTVTTETYLKNIYHQDYKLQMDIYVHILRKMGFEVSDITYFYVCNGEKSHDKFDAKINFSSTLVPYTTKTSWIDLKVEEMKMLLESSLIPEINKSCEHCAYLEGGKEF